MVELLFQIVAFTGGILVTLVGLCQLGKGADSKKIKLFTIFLGLAITISGFISWYAGKKSDAPRKLSTSQSEIIVENLRKNPGKKIAIKYPISDQESINFGKKLWKTIEKGDWKIIPPGTYPPNVDFFGIRIVFNVKPPPETAKLLFDALNSAGLDPKLIYNTNWKKNDFEPEISKDTVILFIGPQN